jgi:hypothetical protein
VHGPSLPDFGPSWNVAPQTFQPVIRLNRDTGDREIVLMRWGLVPFWILLANSGGATEVNGMVRRSESQTFPGASPIGPMGNAGEKTQEHSRDHSADLGISLRFETNLVISAQLIDSE